MSAAVQEPSREQLLAMAYVDGELDGAARAEFEKQLATREDLRREVTQLKRLELLARHAAAPEPMDHEWKKLAREPLHQGSTVLGFAALAIGALGLGGFGVYSVLAGDLETLPKMFFALLIAGAVTLFLVTLRGRLRTLPYDPYTEIER